MLPMPLMAEIVIVWPQMINNKRSNVSYTPPKQIINIYVIQSIG